MSEKNKLQEYCQKNKIPMPVYETWSSGKDNCLQWSAKVIIIVDGKKIIIDTIVPSNSKSSAEKQAALMMLDYISKKHGNPDTQLTKLRNATKLNITSTHKPSIKKENFNKIMVNIDDKISLGSDDDKIFSSSDDKITSNFDDKISSGSDDKVLSSFDDKIFNKILDIYFIDLENKPAFKYKPNDSSIFIGFINSIHNSLPKYSDWHKCQSDNIWTELLNKNRKLIYIIDGGISDLSDHFITAMLYPLVEFISKNNISCTVHIISGDHASWCTRACLEKILKWRKMDYVNVVNAVIMK